jgi:hypothetical protein
MKDEEDSKIVLMQIIKRITPQLLAQQIVGVQPMMTNNRKVTIRIGDDEGVNFGHGFRYWALYDNTRVKLKVNVPSDWGHRTEQQIWCEETFDKDVWTVVESSQCFYFKNIEDRDWFVMRWS